MESTRHYFILREHVKPNYVKENCMNVKRFTKPLCINENHLNVKNYFGIV